jgi:DNA anti-recombination protein RmuC
MKSEDVLDILKDYKNKSNKELSDVLDFLQEDFDKTKDLLVKLTYHLDTTENSYNKILEEYKKRSTHNG